MARSERAAAIVRGHVPAGERVLDLGCGIGFTTARLAEHYETYGIDAAPGHIWLTRRRAPTARLTLGSAERLPYPDGHFAAVVMLDVLEHLANERAVVSEAARVLRPGGLLVLSVPHAGLLRWADSLNIFAWLTGEDPLAPPGTPRASFSFHRHYKLEALRLLLGERFAIEQARYSGWGVAEFVHLAVLLYCKRLLRSRPRYISLVPAYYKTYLWEDRFELGRSGYHLMIAARRACGHVVVQERDQVFEEA